MFGYLITLPLLLVASEASFLRTLHDEADATSERGNVLFDFIRLTFFNKTIRYSNNSDKWNLFKLIASIISLRTMIQHVQCGGQKVGHVNGGQDTAFAIQSGILLVLTGENAHQVLLVQSKILARNLAIIVVILQVKYCPRLNNILIQFV